MVQSRLYSNQQPHRSEKPLQIESNRTQFAVFFLLHRGRFRPALTHGTRAVLSTGFSCEARDHGRKAIEPNQVHGASSTFMHLFVSGIFEHVWVDWRSSVKTHRIVRRDRQNGGMHAF